MIKKASNNPKINPAILELYDLGPLKDIQHNKQNTGKKNKKAKTNEKLNIIDL